MRYMKIDVQRCNWQFVQLNRLTAQRLVGWLVGRLVGRSVGCVGERTLDDNIQCRWNFCAVVCILCKISPLPGLGPSGRNFSFERFSSTMSCQSLKSFADNMVIIGTTSHKTVCNIPIIKGDFESMPKGVQKFVAEKATLMQAAKIFICDGSVQEGTDITGEMIEHGMLTPLTKMQNCFLCRTDPKDVARVESKTFMCTPDKYMSVTHTPPDVQPIMGNWMSPEKLATELDDRFPGCMKGRIMYVIPFSMGPIGSPLSKIGIELTDSPYVVMCMRIMTRVSLDVLKVLGENEFVRCIHSLGCPRPVNKKIVNQWLCNPEKVLIAHRPAEREVWSFGSGYGGNSLLGKKCFALRIACNIARDEGWLAEHMLLSSFTGPNGKERFIAAAFPSACGKTNMAMLLPTLPGWKVKCCGDDIAWMRFREDGQLVGINPEAGFFGVAPGTSHKTNPIAMDTCMTNTIFTNVAETADGGVFWEGMEHEIPDKNIQMTNWLNEPWKIGMPGVSSHPNSRFTTPANQCPIMHPKWEDSAGVPIDAIIFGGRRPEGVPLVFETFDWHHGIFTGACLKSEATAAAEHTGKKIMHDPMAMRPFMGYNFGKYLQHWINVGKPPHKTPKIFHVNWFRVNKDGKFLWPGFGDNIRVIDWILRRLDDEDIATKTAIGLIPKKGSINTEGLNVDWDELFSLPKDYWLEDSKEVRKFFDEQIGSDLPPEIKAELDAQEQRIKAM
ncbi:Phosphoenolpyruvate carboxykinase [GTP] [Trichinella britovi]|nr:Phosphoenolpyruvate carboxykinase [GTP] [Trichinella murrelli]KRX66223.1 Phosphoenolpyruvate carboxykinase [GTP] [Trichinella sp. T9]KRY56642.1 Phosphoenolpyruvate carboxykinase [GTP] [Trichinella britovi]